MADRLNRENLANMGCSGMSGTSQTMQMPNRNNLLNTLGSVNLQQQALYNFNLNKTNLGNQYNADFKSAYNSIQAERNAALLPDEQNNMQTAAAMDGSHKIAPVQGSINKTVF